MLCTPQLLLPHDPVVPDQKVFKVEETKPGRYLFVCSFGQIPDLCHGHGSSLTRHLIFQEAQACSISGNRRASHGVLHADGQILDRATRTKSGELCWVLSASVWAGEFFWVSKEERFFNWVCLLLGCGWSG